MEDYDGEYDEYEDEDERSIERFCERCNHYTLCEEVPLMGYSLWVCRHCAAALYRSGEAV